jgi:hypothetical protein
MCFAGILVIDLTRGFGRIAPTQVLTKINHVSDVFPIERLTIEAIMMVYKINT